MEGRNGAEGIKNKHGKDKINGYWTWNGAQQSRVRAVEMSYLRGACGVNRWDGLSNESVYERCGMRGSGQYRSELVKRDVYSEAERVGEACS